MAMAQAQFPDVPSEGVAPGARARRAGRARGASTRARLLRTLGACAPIAFAYLAALFDAAAIVTAAFAANFLYSAVAGDYAPRLASMGMIGFAAALLVIGSGLQRGEYNLQTYLRKAGQMSRAFPTWNLVFLAILALGFTTKTSSEFSRVAITMFYFFGLANLAMVRRALVDVAAWMLDKRVVNPRRLIIVGFEDRLAEIEASHCDFGKGVDVVNLIALRDNQAYLADDLALAAATVRMHRADDVCLAIPWGRHEVIDACTAAFLRTPAEIHLDADGLRERFGEARFVQLGEFSGLRVTRPRFSLLQRAEKRAFDLLVSGSALIALGPFLALIALLIRLDSPGPALFRQTRYGFNFEPFSILKFRSMKVMENGAAVVSAKRADPRVTRIGAFLRRSSIDELPQLINVLRGEMSIVGPRPHAMAHDQRYIDRLSRYARRHNVKPGITGWAQVNGHRGEIRNDSEMLARLEHDLYYVDNWSLWLDIKIMFMTVFSKKAHANAF